MSSQRVLIISSLLYLFMYFVISLRLNKPSKIYNTAVRNLGNLNKLALNIQRLRIASLLAYQPDLRLKASWNLAAVLLDSYNQQKESTQLIDVISAWQDVLDLPNIDMELRKEARNTLQKLENNKEMKVEINSDITATYKLSESNTFDVLLSLLQNQQRAQQKAYAIERLPLQMYKDVGTLLHCFVSVTMVSITSNNDITNTPENLIPILFNHCVDENYHNKPKPAGTRNDEILLSKFIKLLISNIVYPHKRRMNSHSPKDVIIVGGGPIGLSTAIVAKREGCHNVYIYEKRGMPVRQHWFDANPHTMSFLNTLGLKLFEIRMEINLDMPDYATLQCHVLERFLGLVAMATGIQVYYKVMVDRIDAEFNFIHLTDTNNLNNYLSSTTFDLLFVCDGMNSVIRKNMKQVSFSYQNVFNLPESRKQVMLFPNYNITTNEIISQTSLILAFKTDENGKCPHFDKSISAYESTLINEKDQRITTIFKRLYEPFCECQILFSNSTFPISLKVGQVHIDDENIITDEIWELVRQHLNTFFYQKFTCVKNLKENLIPYVYKNNNKNSKKLRHAVLFRMGIQKTEHAAYAHKGGSIIVFRGDALVSAHYRLGIGLNQGIESMDIEVTALVKQFIYQNTEESTHNLVHLARERASPRIEWMVNVQLVTLFFESYCNIVVDNSNLQKLSLLYRNYEQHKFIDLYQESDILSLKCLEKFKLL
jgi:hypothetical protein